MYVSYAFITDGQPALLALRGVARCACVFGKGVGGVGGGEKCVSVFFLCVSPPPSLSAPVRVSVLARVDPRPAWHASTAPLRNQAPCPSFPRPSTTSKSSMPRDTSVTRHTHVSQHCCPSSPRPCPPSNRVVLGLGAVTNPMRRHP